MEDAFSSIFISIKDSLPDELFETFLTNIMFISQT